MYSVSVGETIHSFPTRQEAITAARDMSSKMGATLKVKHDDGKEALTYRNGQLEYYELRTQRRRRV